MFDAITKFRNDLDSGKRCLGIGITLSDPLISEAIADSVDFLWIDLEHSSMSPEVVNGHLLAARGKHKIGIVRVPGSATHLIKTALDSGADGIIVPQVKGVEEVKSIIADCRYPPLGQRGFGPRVPSNYGRSSGMDYIEEANAKIWVAVMIETAEAFGAIEQICSLPGLDSVIIGTADLTLALGEKRNTRSPKMEAAFRKIISIALTEGKYAGAGMGADLDFALFLAKMGAQWLQVGGDFEYIVRHFDLIQSSFNSSWAELRK